MDDSNSDTNFCACGPILQGHGGEASALAAETDVIRPADIAGLFTRVA
jgi:hypothetical protein